MLWIKTVRYSAFISVTALICRWGRFGIFIVASNRLATVFPVAPRRCCALRWELSKLRHACLRDLCNASSDAVAERVKLALEWLDNTFPGVANGKDDKDEMRSIMSWIEADFEQE